MSEMAMNERVVATATLTNVASSGTTVLGVAANKGRRGLSIFNDSTAILYIKYGATASTTSYTLQMATNTFWQMAEPVYSGRIDFIWASANGNARVTELAN